MRLLITGARGLLGAELMARVEVAGHRARGSSRRPRPSPEPVPVGQAEHTREWVRADLIRDDLGSAAAGVDAIVHAATSPFRNSRAVDVDGTSRLLAAAAAAGVRHFVYVSITGVDRVPHAYYRNKVEAERLVAGGGVPWTVVRASQFHPWLLRPIEAMGRLGVLPVPAGFRFQPVDLTEVADHLVAVAAGPPLGRAPDFAGPEVRTMEDLARSWADIRRRRALVLPIPLPGRIASAFRQGAVTNPDRAVGRLTWEEFLRRG